MTFREKIEDIKLSIRKISEKASEQEECIRLDIGQPSFDTPDHIKQATKQALDNKQGYSPMLGLKQLREQIAKEESGKADIENEKARVENVMVTTGGMGALYSIFSARLEETDTAIFNDPCWGPYKMISSVNGNKFEQVQYWNEDGELSQSAKEKIKKSKLAVVNTPSNPTGKVLTEEQAKEIAKYCGQTQTFLISDEVYHRLTYNEEHYSPAACTENAAIIGSVSKNHAMTGWRVGWIIDKPKNIEQYAKVSRATTACPPRISQYAATEALKNDQHVKKMRKEYQERKELIKKRMDQLGWSYTNPEGAIYTFPDTGRDSWELCLSMVEKGVAMVPGEPMGPESDTNVRLCFGSTTKKEINKAFDILEEEL